VSLVHGVPLDAEADDEADDGDAGHDPVHAMEAVHV